MRVLPAILLLAAALPGCGAGSATLTGKVSIRGVPISMGTVTAVNDAGDIGSAEIQDDGTYTIENCPKGNVKITVLSPNPVEVEKQMEVFKKSGRFQSAPPQLINSRPLDPKKWIEIPENYGDPDRSGLTTEVSGGTNEFPIVIQ